MNRTDALVAAIGAGVLVIALAGAALTGSDSGGGDGAELTLADRHAEHDLGTATTQGSGTAELAFDNPHRNTTALTFTVTVSADAPHAAVQGDTIQVVVTGPDGTEYTGEGAGPAAGGGSSTIEVPVTVQAAPERATPGDAGNATGTGVWTVTVNVNHGGLAPEAHTVGAAVEVHWYEAEATPQIPTTR